MKPMKTIIGSTILMMSLASSLQAQRTIGGGTLTLNPCVFVADQDNFSNASTWTKLDPTIAGNGQIFINTSQNNITFNSSEVSGSGCLSTGQQGACSNREMRVYRPLSTTVSNNSWRAEFVINIASGNAPNHGLMGLTAGTQDPEGNYVNNANPWGCASGGSNSGTWGNTTQDGIFASLVAFGANQIPSSFNSQVFNPTHQTAAANATTTGGWCIYGHAKKSNNAFYSALSPSGQLNWSWGIPLPALATNYYLRLERITPSMCMISVFSDAARTVHVPMSPQCFQIDPTIQGLNTAQNFTHQSGSYFRSLGGLVSDLYIYNGCPGLPTLNLSASSTTLGCTPTTITLTATPGFSTYTWIPGNITTTTNTLAVTPASPTVYTVSAIYNAVTYPCYVPTATVQIVGHPTYLTFDPHFAITSGLPAYSTTFSVGVTPVPGSTNLDISNAVASTGLNYGYLWKVETLDPTNNSNVICSVPNPSNWWNNATTNYFSGYSSTSTGGCSDNTSITTGTGAFDISHKYKITRGVWNPCIYTEATVAVSYCTNCRTSNGQPALIIEGDALASDKTTGIDQLSGVEKESILTIAPNPHHGEFSLMINNGGEAYTYEVYDSLGSLILHNSSNEAKQDIVMPDSKSGVYIIKINIAGKLVTKRIIKE